MNSIQYSEHLAIFVEVVRAESFSAVARQRGVVPSSVVRQIDALEQNLDVRLFVRSTRGLRLTDAGEMFYERSLAILNALIDARAELANLVQTPRGLLRVSCLPTFGRLYILPLLPAFMRDYPDVQVELDLTERATDPTVERLDATIRMGELKDSSLIATRLGTQRWLVCASPSYLDGRDRPGSIVDLEGHLLLDKRHDPNGIGWRKILPPQSTCFEKTVFRCDDYEALREAAVGGMGIAFLPNWVVANDIVRGRLEILFEDPSEQKMDIHLLRAFPKMPAKLRVFVEALKGMIEVRNF